MTYCVNSDGEPQRTQDAGPPAREDRLVTIPAGTITKRICRSSEHCGLYRLITRCRASGLRYGRFGGLGHDRGSCLPRRLLGGDVRRHGTLTVYDTESGENPPGSWMGPIRP